jgi:hypothetical protein
MWRDKEEREIARRGDPYQRAASPRQAPAATARSRSGTSRANPPHPAGSPRAGALSHPLVLVTPHRPLWPRRPVHR